MIRLLCFVSLLWLFLGSFVCKAQVSGENKMTPDSTNENVIVEYDTVYLAPDTIKQIDTIVNYTKDKANKKKYGALNQAIKHILPGDKGIAKPSDIQLEGIFPGKIIEHNWTFLCSVQPYITDVFSRAKINDSLSFKKLANIGFNMGFSYHKKGLTYALGIAYTSFHEQIDYQGQYYTSNVSQLGSSLYDSLLVKKNCITDDYFQLLGLNLSLGYVWSHRKLNFGLSALLSTDILLNYSALNAERNAGYDKIASHIVRSFGFSIGVQPLFAYKLSNRWNVFLAPYYGTLLNKSQKYPLTMASKTAINIGVGIIL